MLYISFSLYLLFDVFKKNQKIGKRKEIGEIEEEREEEKRNEQRERDEMKTFHQENDYEVFILFHMKLSINFINQTINSHIILKFHVFNIHRCVSHDS